MVSKLVFQICCWLGKARGIRREKLKTEPPFFNAWRRTCASSRSKNAANSDDNRIIFDDDFARHQSTTPSTTASWFAQSHGSSKLQFWRCRERRLGRWCSYRSDDQCEFGLSELPLWRGISLAGSSTVSMINWNGDVFSIPSHQLK